MVQSSKEIVFVDSKALSGKYYNIHDDHSPNCFKMVSTNDDKSKSEGY